MNKDFEQYEIEGRDKFKALFVPQFPNIKNLTFTPIEDKRCYDATFKINDIIYIVEIKQRDFSYRNWKDMLLEYDKYTSLLNIRKQLLLKASSEVRLLYVHTYECINDYMKYITLPLNLSNFIIKDLPRSKVLDNGDKPKLITYLHNYNEIKNNITT